MKTIAHQLCIAIALSTGSLVLGQTNNTPVHIGYITDLSGPFADNDGPYSLHAIQMAVEDFGNTVLGRPIQLLSADHQNRTDIASNKARQWADTQDLHLLIGGANSAAMLAINAMVPEKQFIFMVIAAGSPAFTNEQCTPWTVQYAYNTVALARTLGYGIAAGGAKSWYFLTTDYTFGHSLEAETRKVITASGGTTLGAVKVPMETSDYSSFLLQAQASGAQVLGMASSGSHVLNTIRTAKEFGLTMQLAGLILFANNVDALGQEDAQGLLFPEPWYWDQDDAARQFATRFYAKTQKMPNSLHAASYSAALTWLKAVQAAGTTDRNAVMAQLRKTPINDMYTKGYLREDGQMIHDFHLYEVKPPAVSSKPWDYLQRVAVVPGEQAFTSLSESTCPLVKK